MEVVSENYARARAVMHHNSLPYKMNLSRTTLHFLEHFLERKFDSFHSPRRSCFTSAVVTASAPSAVARSPTRLHFHKLGNEKTLMSWKVQTVEPCRTHAHSRPHTTRPGAPTRGSAFSDRLAMSFCMLRASRYT